MIGILMILVLYIGIVFYLANRDGVHFIGESTTTCTRKNFSNPLFDMDIIDKVNNISYFSNGTRK